MFFSDKNDSCKKILLPSARHLGVDATRQKRGGGPPRRRPPPPLGGSPSRGSLFNHLKKRKVKSRSKKDKNENLSAVDRHLRAKSLILKKTIFLNINLIKIVMNIITFMNLKGIHQIDYQTSCQFVADYQRNVPDLRILH